jgi:argininosuccinate synthase
MKSVVLAFSGGLDTTFCAVYLSKVLNLEVDAVTVNTGGFSASELKEIEAHAFKLGVANFTALDVMETYYKDSVRFLIYGNMLKNGTYPLSVSAERLIQAMEVARYAKSINADYIAHGSTGAGNDQVRFDSIFRTMIPGAEILTPIRDLKLSREAEIQFLQENNVHINTEKSHYSINKGLWGTSVGGKETLGSSEYLPEIAWPTQITETNPRVVEIEFFRGEPKALDAVPMSPVALIQKLQSIAQPYGIGRDIHVGDTIIGIKGRVGFEAASALILIKAHHLLEKHTLTKWQTYWKDQLSVWYANWMHEGQILDPVMRHIEIFLEASQETVSGKVRILLEPKHFTLLGIESEHDLMNTEFGTYGEMNLGWSAEDVKGFTKIAGNQVSIFHQINKTNHD